MDYPTAIVISSGLLALAICVFAVLRYAEEPAQEDSETAPKQKRRRRGWKDTD